MIMRSRNDVELVVLDVNEDGWWVGEVSGPVRGTIEALNKIQVVSIFDTLMEMVDENEVQLPYSKFDADVGFQVYIEGDDNENESGD
jgi:hypothetical protein